jgi:hypothetical protein
LPSDPLSALQAFETAIDDHLARDDDRTSDRLRIATPEWQALQQLARRTLFARPQTYARLEQP